MGGGTGNEDPRGLAGRFPLPGRLLRVELPDLFLCLAAQDSELHPDRAIIYPLYRAGRPDGPVAEGEAEVKDQLGPERDRLLRGEERPCSPEFGDPPLPGWGVLDLVLHGEVAGNAGRASRISRVIHDDGGRGREESGKGEASPRGRSTTLPIKAAFKESTARNFTLIPGMALGPISSPRIHTTCAGIESVWEG